MGIATRPKHFYEVEEDEGEGANDHCNTFWKSFILGVFVLGSIVVLFFLICGLFDPFWTIFGS